ASQEAPAAPHGIYPCAGEERWIAITVFTDAEWERFADAAGGPAWTRDTRFATRAGRVRHAAELDRRVAQWTRGQKAEEAMAIFRPSATSRSTSAALPRPGGGRRPVWRRSSVFRRFRALSASAAAASATTT